MDYVKKAIWGPDPKEQHKKIKSILRKNSRQIDKSLLELQSLQNKTKQLIKKSAKKDDLKSIKIYATELYQINKQYNRMYTSKAQLESVSMKIEEAYKMQTLTKQMAKSTILMHEVNQLVHLPQLQNTMVELEKELMRAGIISEMIDDAVEIVEPGEEEFDEEANDEVNKIIEEFTKEKVEESSNTNNNVPVQEFPELPEIEKEANSEEKVDEDSEKMLNDMRERLRALQN